ncbi:MAG: AAA family ATPase, partial [Dehalococcoidia bacterium]|nr:AAA family ATPase [Dehalococcoidia bacterium]
MGCPACGAENPVAAKFCQECGSPQPRRCPACGHDVGATAKFCPECGERLGGATPRRLAPSQPAAPQAYTPRHLAEKILAGRDALAGERKQVTVLFADVVGSTELIRDLDPEDAQHLLDGVVARMMDAVHRFEGTVSRAMGDGIMALFGAPLAHEDHALRACYAALAMLEAVRVHADEVRRTHGATIQIRVGLNSGEVIVRLISDDLHMDYTALGPTVHLASRLEGLANAGTALLGPATLKLVDGLVETRPLGAVEVKGLERPLPVYELVGPGAARTRLRAAAARGLTPFVGRDDEETVLARALERARGGRAQVVALVGEPGVGKSRMAWEVARSPGTADWLVLEAECVSHGSASPYLPIIGLLRRYVGIEAADDAHASRGKMASKLSTLDRALESCLPPLLALLDVPVEDGDWQRLDPSQRRRRIHEAVKWALLREGRERPLLMVFEDLHWIDEETQALLDDLVNSLPTARVVLLVTYRPEYGHEWGRKTYYDQIRVDPLRETSARALLASLLGDDPSVEPLKGPLAAWTEGNPLFLEESVRALAELQVLAGERGAYRLPAPVAGLPIPPTVHAVLASRIDRLSAADKALLQMAAVVGRDVPAAVLRAIAGRDEDDLRRRMAALQAAEFVYEARLFPEL